MQTKATTWIGGAVFVALIMLVGAWFLLISPVMSSASASASEASDAETHNDALNAQLAKLKQQNEHLDEYKAELATLRAQIPSTAELDTYTKTLDSMAKKADVVIVEDTPGTPLAVVPGIPPEVQKALDDAKAKADEDSSSTTDDSTASTTDADGSTATAAQPTLPKQFTPIAGFVALPMDVTVVGAPTDVLAFLAAVQKGDPRPFLVTALDGKGLPDAEAANGRPATHEGDLELKISGYAYVLIDPVQSALDAAATTDPLAQYNNPTPMPTDRPSLPSSGDANDRFTSAS